VAALPHDAGAGASGLRENPPCCGEIGASAAIADATLFRFKRPVGHCTPPEKHLHANESVSEQSNVNMRISDRYISMTYRDVCADDYGHAQFDTNDINGLAAKLRSRFI
jgi:hypothetical protein